MSKRKNSSCMSATGTVSDECFKFCEFHVCSYPSSLRTPDDRPGAMPSGAPASGQGVGDDELRAVEACGSLAWSDDATNHGYPVYRGFLAVDLSSRRLPPPVLPHAMQHRYNVKLLRYPQGQQTECDLPILLIRHNR